MDANFFKGDFIRIPKNWNKSKFQPCFRNDSDFFYDFYFIKKINPVKIKKNNFQFDFMNESYLF